MKFWGKMIYVKYVTRSTMVKKRGEKKETLGKYSHQSKSRDKKRKTKKKKEGEK